MPSGASRLQKIKMRRLHGVTLTKQALAIIRDLQAISGGRRWLSCALRFASRTGSIGDEHRTVAILTYG
jgi:hypothetical protein